MEPKMVAVVSLGNLIKSYRGLTSEGDIKNAQNIVTILQTKKVVIDDPSVVCTLLGTDPDVKNVLIYGTGDYIGFLYMKCYERGETDSIDKYLGSISVMLSPEQLELLQGEEK